MVPPRLDAGGARSAGERAPAAGSRAEGGLRAMSAAPRPNLFIIGAMKCGTTSLHAYLDTHPAIFMCSPKEPNHFVDRAEMHALFPTLAGRGYWRTEEYLALFRAAGDAVIVGESSTNYSKLPHAAGVAQRIAAFNPDARFIYLMRDPLRRTISHYWHLVRGQLESRDMLTALREEPQYINVSHYAMQLRPYLELFGPGRVMTLVTEELEADPLVTLQDVFGWLGVAPGFVPPNLDRREGVTPGRFEAASTVPLLRRFRHSMLWGALAPAVPPALKSAARRYLYWRRPVEIPAAPPREVVDYLRPILIAQTDELCRLLGRTFPLWTTSPASQARAVAGSACSLVERGRA